VNRAKTFGYPQRTEFLFIIRKMLDVLKDRISYLVSYSVHLAVGRCLVRVSKCHIIINKSEIFKMNKHSEICPVEIV